MQAQGAPSFAECSPALSEPTLRAIEALRFTHMTPVQAATVPLFLSHKDVCVQACTGSGKTVAFLVPVFEMLRRRETSLAASQVGAIVIAPTRELARQIFGVCEHFCGFHTEFKAMLLVGGTDIAETLQQLDSSGANILIGTPGRMLDVLKRSDPQYVKELEVLVLDEADTLLDMGFQNTLNEILGLLPKQRRTGLFSATQTGEVKELARAGMRNPVTVKVQVESKAKALQVTPTNLMNCYMTVPYDQKPSQLVHFLKAHQEEKILVFAMTCAAVDFWTGMLRELPQLADMRENIMGLHGKMVPAKRTGTYDRFVKLERGVLICTDVAARGIDIPDVDWIVQYDAPKDPSFFIHRVGRTARAGRAGRALVMLSGEEDAFVNFLELKHVPMTALAPYQDVEDVLEAMKNCVKTDRALLEHGTEAFIGFLRAYKEHQCSYIFRMEALNVGALARSYALLRLPKIKELRVKGDIDFVPDEIDTSLIPYKQKAREVARQKRLQAQREENERKRQSEEESNDRKRKQQEDRQKQQQQQQQQKKKPKGKHQHILAEWDELAREELLYKRFKKGKMSKAEYDRSLLRWKNEDDDLEPGAGSDDGSFGSDDSDDEGAAPRQQAKKARTGNEVPHGGSSNKLAGAGRKNNKKNCSRGRK